MTLVLVLLVYRWAKKKSSIWAGIFFLSSVGDSLFRIEIILAKKDQVLWTLFFLIYQWKEHKNKDHPYLENEDCVWFHGFYPDIIDSNEAGDSND